MTATEMHLAFKFGLDKVDSQNLPGLEPEEVDLLLNQAQDRLIKQRYGFNNPKRQSFEETQKRTEDLKEVVVNAILTPAVNATDNIDSNAQFVTLPTSPQHWFIIQERVDLTCPDCHDEQVTTRVKVEAIQHNEFNSVINNPFKGPNKEKVLRLMEDGRVELIKPTGCVLGDYYLRYIKRPNRIDGTNTPNVNCELSDHLHQEIVDEAIKVALENIEAKRQQTFTSIDLTKE